tara:strand:+ start:257 stop:637 length:381 start_codon:yes stop_codon:yes gene_type:complete
MAGKIVADTLEHSTAGSLDTQFVVNGSAKTWVNYNQATPTVNSSLNTSSVTDSSAGRFIVNFTSAFSGANEYNWSGMSQSGSSSAYNCTIQMDGTPTTTTCAYETVFNNGTFSDLHDGVTIHGDLA